MKIHINRVICVQKTFNTLSPYCDYLDVHCIKTNIIMFKLLPDGVKLEASSLCQLDCRECWMRKQNYADRGPGYLKFMDFVKFLEMNPFVKRIELSGAGEIFLNPDLYEIIQHAHSKGVVLSAGNGVNLNTVSDEVLEALVKCEFSHVSVSLDGASQETYSWYRRNGNFDIVINNIKKINEFKKKYNTDRPFMIWQYIIFESNQSESEIKKAKEMANDLNCKIIFTKDGCSGFIPDDLPMVERETGLCYEHVDIRNTWSNRRVLHCLDLWNMPQINYDGRLFGCCTNVHRSFGLNVFELGLEKSLNSKVVKETKEMLMGGKICEDSPCKDCWFFKQLVSEKNLVKEEEIMF